MNRRVGVAICVVLLTSGVLASCTKSDDDNLTREEFIEQLTSGSDGMPVEMATCIADGLEGASIEVDADGEPSDEDKAKAEDIAVQCFADANGIDPSSIPDLDSTSSGG